MATKSLSYACGRELPTVPLEIESVITRHQLRLSGTAASLEVIVLSMREHYHDRPEGLSPSIAR